MCFLELLTVQEEIDYLMALSQAAVKHMDPFYTDVEIWDLHSSGDIIINLKKGDH